MSEYKRLTNKDWKENYDIFEDVCCDTCADDCGKCEKNFNALVRLAELEDKIESGELCNKKEITKEYHDKFAKVIQERDYVEGYAEIGMNGENDEILKSFGVEV